MQTGKLTHSSRVECMHPAFKKLFDYIKTADFDALPTGKIEIDGDNLFIMNNKLEGKPAEEAPLEVHRKYIDVQELLSGHETFGIKPLEEIETFYQPYDEEKDCALSTDKPRYFINLVPGEFCILYPEDGHAPAIGSGPIHKLIAKVKI